MLQGYNDTLNQRYIDFGIETDQYKKYEMYYMQKLISKSELVKFKDDLFNKFLKDNLEDTLQSFEKYMSKNGVDMLHIKP